MPRASGWLWSSLCSLHQRSREWWWGEVSETMAGWHPLYQPCISVTIWDHFSGMNIYCAVLARMKQVWKKVTCQEIICPIKWNTVYSIIIPCPTSKDKREISHHWHATSWSTLGRFSKSRSTHISLFPRKCCCLCVSSNLLGTFSRWCWRYLSPLDRWGI